MATLRLVSPRVSTIIWADKGLRTSNLLEIVALGSTERRNCALEKRVGYGVRRGLE
jgi:hypothetical protein